MLFSMASCCVVWICVTAATAVFAGSNETNAAAAKATVAFIFIFGAVYSIGLTPLQALYPVEVLSFEMRAKRMAFSSLAVNAGGLLNQFAWPVSLKAIGWHTYIVFIVWDAIQATVFYFLMPETKNRTVCLDSPVFSLLGMKTNGHTWSQFEELDQIFAAKNPVKESLKAKKVALSADRNAVGVEEA